MPAALHLCRTAHLLTLNAQPNILPSRSPLLTPRRSSHGFSRTRTSSGDVPVAAVPTSAGALASVTHAPTSPVVSGLALSEQYQLLEKLGTGSFGTVYKGMHRETRQIVAIKQIDLEDSDDDISEIQMEIAHLAQCDSEWVTRYYGSFVKGYKLWIGECRISRRWGWTDCARRETVRGSAGPRRPAGDRQGHPS